MDATSGFRTICANIDIHIADFIENIYNLIFDIASVDSFFKSISEMINKVYMILGLFMLFKLAISVINYIINPDYLTSKDKGVSKFLQRIILSLALLSIFPVVFKEMYSIQAIVLNENVIGKIILGNTMSKEEMSSYGKKVSYYVFSRFLDYSRYGDIGELVFPDTCPNIFLEKDVAIRRVRNKYTYCQKYGGDNIVNICANFLTPHISYTDDYIDNGCLDEKNHDKKECQELLRLDSRDLYYDCKDGLTVEYGDLHPTINCGIRNGLHISALISTGRENYDVSKILSKEVITAVESDPLFVTSYCPANVAAKFEEKLEYEIVNEDVDSAGDYVFSYNALFSVIVGFIVLIMFIILSIDVAIRAVKLLFLQVIAPIPIVSNIDIKESKLFKNWLKLLINTYLELFIKLASIFLSLFIIITVIENKSDVFAPIKNNVMAQMTFIIGAIMFAIKLPDFLSKLTGSNMDGGFTSIIKGAASFVLGFGAATVAGIGGATSNLAAGVENIKDAQGGVAKTLSAIKTPFSMLGGFGSSAARTVGRQIQNGGKVGLYDIKAGMRGSVSARHQNESGNFIWNRFADELRDISQINPKDRLDSSAIKKEIENIKIAQEKNDMDIQSMLDYNNNANLIRDAYRIDGEKNRIYKDYDEYHNATNSSLSKDDYDEVAYLYEQRDEFNKKLKELEERLEREVSNEAFAKLNKKS